VGSGSSGRKSRGDGSVVSVALREPSGCGGFRVVVCGYLAKGIIKFLAEDVSGITTLKFFLNFPRPPDSPSPGEGKGGVLLALLLGEDAAEDVLECDVSEGDDVEDDGAWWLDSGGGLPMRGC